MVRSMRGEKEMMAVFVESSLGTHLALSAPTGAVAGDLKRKIEGEHLCCFQSIGKIRVQSLMVKHKSVFYHLPDSIPAKEAFRGFAGTCFFYMVASQLATLPDEESAPPPTFKRSAELESIGQSEIMETNSRFTNTLTSYLLARDSLKDHSSSGLGINLETEEEIITSGLNIDSLENKGSSGSRFKKNAIKNRGNKTETDCPLHDKELAVFLLPSLSQKNQNKRRKLDSSAKMNQDEKGIGTCNKALILECDYDQSFEEEKQKEDNSKADDSLGVNLKETTWSSGNFSVANQNNISSSTKEISPGNVSEKMSVTGLISRFFSDDDEVNTPYQPLINTMDADKVAVQSDNSLKHDQHHQKEVDGCKTAIAGLLKENDISKRLVSNTSGVFPSEPNHLNLTCPTAKNLKKNEVTDVTNERHSEDNIALSTEHSSSDEVDNSSLAGSKFCRCRSLTNRKSNYRDYRGWIKSPPTCEFCKYKVGKRLIQAANKICCPSSEKRSSTLYNLRCKNMCSDKLFDLAKRFSFESSDSRDH